MNTRYLVAGTLAAAGHALLLFGFTPPAPPPSWTTNPPGPVALVPPPSDPVPEPPEPDPEEAESDLPPLPPEFDHAGLVEPTPNHVGTGMLTIVVKPEPPRMNRDHRVVTTIPVSHGSSKVRPSKVETIFSDLDLDRSPRVRYEASPTYPHELNRLRIGGWVTAAWVVNREGRVAEAWVEGSSNPAFERSVLEAVFKYRCEPGTRGGRPVSFRMRRTFNFNPL